MVNFDKRDRILFGSEYQPEKYNRGLRYFNHLHRHELRELLNSRLVNLYPWTLYAEFWWFMEKFGNDNKLYLHALLIRRNDQGRTI